MVSGRGFVKSTDIETIILQPIDFCNNRIQNQCLHKQYVYLFAKTQIASEETMALRVMYYICAVIQHSRCGSCQGLEQITSGNYN